MKVQTLGDTSSLTSCSLFESLSTNHWAGPQEVAICGHHGDRVCGWALKLMRYLEQMKYDTGGQGRWGGRGRRCGDGNGERETGRSVTWRTKSWTSEKQEAESQAPSMRGGVDEKRRDKAFAPALYRTQGFCYHTCAGCRPIRLLGSGFTFQHLAAKSSSCSPSASSPLLPCTYQLTNKLQTF